MLWRLKRNNAKQNKRKYFTVETSHTCLGICARFSTSCKWRMILHICTNRKLCSKRFLYLFHRHDWCFFNMKRISFQLHLNSVTDFCFEFRKQLFRPIINVNVSEKYFSTNNKKYSIKLNQYRGPVMLNKMIISSFCKIEHKRETTLPMN